MEAVRNNRMPAAVALSFATALAFSGCTAGAMAPQPTVTVTVTKEAPQPSGVLDGFKEATVLQEKFTPGNWNSFDRYAASVRVGSDNSVQSINAVGGPTCQWDPTNMDATIDPGDEIAIRVSDDGTNLVFYPRPESVIVLRKASERQR